MKRKGIIGLGVLAAAIVAAFLIFRSMTYAILDELVAVRAERKSDSAVEVKFETVTSISEGGGTIEIECLKGNKVFLTDDTGEAKEIFSD